MSHRLRRRALGLTVLMLLALVVPLAGAQEDTNFTPRHSGVDYPVGWTDIDTNPFSPASVYFRIVYPAMEDGEDAQIAGNGPFPWVAFFGDDGESHDGYMMLTTALAKRGYATIVSPGGYDADDIEANANSLSVMRERMSQFNNGGEIDFTHWAVAGHGTGAATASLVQPFLGRMNPPPRAVFGLGADFSDVAEGWDWDDGPEEANFFTPKAGLFLTGTVDEVAPSQDSLDRLKSFDGIGWHWMHVVGADHYQFQDTRSIFEGEDDASMTHEEQIQFTADHVVPYLDTTLRGDHAQFRSAFNRPLAPSTVSDPQAYIQEDLSKSDWLRFRNESANHVSSSQLNGSVVLVSQVDWVLRNGDSFHDIPSTWDVSATCGWRGGTWGAAAEVFANGTVQCTAPMSTVPPGQHELVIRVEVEGGGGEFVRPYGRGNVPMNLVEPQPTVYIPQRGETLLNMSEVAIDPDNQAVRVLAASMDCPESQRFGVEVVQDGQGVLVSHALDEEWLGECQVDLELRADGETDDLVSTSLRVVITPVDDPLVRLGPVPILELEEDGEALMYNLTNAISDPEGATLQIVVDGSSSGQQGPVGFVFSGNILTLSPLPDANGAVVLEAMVSDGTHSPIQVEIPVAVSPVDDPIRINTSAWSNLTTNEDAPFVLHADELAYDVDGEALTWALEETNTSLSVAWENGSFILTPTRDFFGTINDVWLNVSDSTSNYSGVLSLEVLPVPDAAILAIRSVQREAGQSTATMQWEVIDVDGEVNTDAILFIDGVSTNVSHSCLPSPGGVYQCVSLIPLPAATNASVFIELKIFDDVLNRTVVAQYTLGVNDVVEENPEVDAAEGEGGLSVRDTLVLLVVLAGAVVLGLYTSRSKRTSIDEVDVGHGAADEPQDDEPKRGSGGLLARAEQLK